ncbi:MAG: aminotransferase class I/II-fold pyridoxal phosphate-dependent enzyme [Anaerolineaceae bacterium]|nr:aminotransferase class I/II-fold pyridoxal phosphate-dependent enzyme [Anaerolineaceae bacterium]
MYVQYAEFVLPDPPLLTRKLKRTHLPGTLEKARELRKIYIMKLKPFKLERYFARYEFSAEYLLSCSDCDGLSQRELVAMADDALKEMWDRLSLGYTESRGSPILRSEIAKLYQGIHPDQCLVAAPQEGILIALNTILQTGGHVICTYPGYQSLYEVAEGLGCEVTRWEPEEAQGWRFNPDFLEANIRPNTKLIVVNFPHNPTGYLPSADDFHRIVELARAHDLYLFCDEMYRYLEYDPRDRLPSACELYEKAVTLFGMSKTFGMAGVRIGWLVTQDGALYQKMAEFKDYTTICSSAPSEILSVIALRNRDGIIARHLLRIRRNLGLLDAFFEEYQDTFAWVRPRAGTIAFPRLKGELSALDFCQDLVTKADTMLLPAVVYDYDDSHFRLGFGRENMPAALEWLRGYLEARR